MTCRKILLVFLYLFHEQSIVLGSMGVSGITPNEEFSIPTRTERSLDGLGFNTSVVSCPYVSYCVYDYIEPLTDSNDTFDPPCCRRCDNTDKLAMFCCPDITPCTLPAASPLNEDKVCISLVFDRHYHEPGVLAIATCKENSEKKERVMCLQKYTYSNVNISDVVPVTDTLTFEVYRNIHCALCNGLNTVNIRPWSVHVVCTLTGNINLAQYPDLIEFINQKEQCAIFYENPFQDIQVKRCDTTIVSCNVSERARERMYSRDQIACLNGPLIPQSYVSYTTMTFKNIACSRCNNVLLKSTTILKPAFPAFSTVIAMESSPDVDHHTSSNCQPGMVFIPLKKHCVEARCSIVRRLKDNSCKKSISVVDSFTYKIVFRIKLYVDIDINTAINVVGKIGEILEGILHAVFMGIADKLHEVLLVSNVKMRDQLLDSEIMNAPLLWIDIRTKLKNTETQDPEKKVSSLLRVTTVTTHSITINQKVSHVKIIVKDDTDNTIYNRPLNKICSFLLSDFEPCSEFESLNLTQVLEIPRNVSFVTIPYYGKYEYMNTETTEFYASAISAERNILEYRNCIWIQVLHDDLHWEESWDGIQFKKTGTFISFSQFIYGENKEEIWVCVATYNKIHNSGLKLSPLILTVYSTFFALLTT